MIMYPLTHPQKRIWYIEKIYPNTCLYTIMGSIRIKGTVDFGLLEAAIDIQIKKHEGLRVKLIENNGEASQYVSEYEKTKLNFIDFSIYEDPEREFKNWVEKELKKPFDLDNGKLFDFPLFKISDRDNGFLIKFHHVISDGWSSNLMIQQILDIYTKLLNGEEIDDRVEYSYLDYIGQERKYLESERFQKNKLFWNERFKVLPEAPLNYSSDFIEGNRRTYELDARLSAQIKDFATNNKCSINTFFVLLYLLYLYKINQENEVVIGTPVLNRSGQKEKNIFGMFTSTMPFRFTFNDESAVTETMIMIHKQLTECYYNQKYPYNLLVQDLEIKRKGYDNLFNICVNYYNTKVKTELNDGVPVEIVEFYSGNQLYSLQLVVKDWLDSGSLIVDMDYKIHDYTEEQIDHIYRQLNNLVTQIIVNPHEKVSKLSLLSEDEKKLQLDDFNATKTEYPKEKTIVQLFEEQVARTPDKIAISFNNEELSYRVLNDKINQLARFLAGKGVEKQSIVGLLTDHSIETVIGIFGIIKAGAAYLPVEPDYPDERISYMLEDSGCRILLTNLEVSDHIGFKGEIVSLHDPNIFTGPVLNLAAVNKPNDLVYVIYTSGSTGKPKGVMIEHRGLVNYIWWAKKMYVREEHEVFPLYSSLAFDLTVTSIFTPLISGGRIIVYLDNEDMHVLYRIMNENQATVVKLTPSHLSLLKDMDNSASSVKRFIVGGEDLKAGLAKSIHESFGGKLEIFNEYGPTEAVVGCMIHKYDFENDTKASVPIGMPADNVNIYILDRSHNLIPLNTIGEMYISGDGIARGYLNRAELTKEKFIYNPFVEHKRMYRTGDLAKLLSTGVIEYVGRADHQVKIRGYRIELGEIEKQLLDHSAIKDAVVIDRKNEHASKFLYAYIVKSKEISSLELRNDLLNYLPEYMVPSDFIDLDEIPLNSNGKVNRSLLPEPQRKYKDNREMVTIKSEKADLLIKILSEALNIENISVTDNFHHLGGDSIKAIQVVSRLKSAGFRIKTKEILSNPVIEKMLLYITQEQNEILIDQRSCQGSIRPTPIVSWFFEQNFKNPNHYNQSLLLVLKQDIEVGKLEQMLNELVKHHDALRINFDAHKQELFYRDEAHLSGIKLEVVHLADYPYAEQKIKMAQSGTKIKAGINIECDLLLKACLFDLGSNGKRLLLTAHHLSMDGISWRIILEDLVSRFKNFELEKVESLPLKTYSFQAWAHNLWSYQPEVLKEQKYWESVAVDHNKVATDFDLGEDLLEFSGTIMEHLTQKETDQLLIKANAAYGTEPKDLLISSLAMTIFEVFRMNEVVIELEGHGREEITDHLDISRTVGWFTSIYPVRLIQVGTELQTQIKSIKEQLRKIPQKGIGFGVLKYLTKVGIEKNQQKRIRFNFLGDFDASFNNSLFSFSSEDSGDDCSLDNQLTSLMDINTMVIDHQLHVHIKFSKNKFKQETLDFFTKAYKAKLKEILNHCCKKNGMEFTPSDFETLDISQDELDGLLL